MRPRVNRFGRRVILKEMEIGNKRAHLWASQTIVHSLGGEVVDRRCTVFSCSGQGTLRQEAKVPGFHSEAARITSSLVFTPQAASLSPRCPYHCFLLFSFFLPNAFSCLLMVWAAPLMKVSSSFLMQLPLPLICLFVLVQLISERALESREENPVCFWGTLNSRINAGMYICMLKTKRKRAFKKNNETDLKSFSS